MAAPTQLESLREGGRIAAAARERGARMILPGARVREVCEAVEEEIRRRGGGLAFPVQSSRNQVAAHACPSPLDESTYAEGDLAKLDIGVHVEGWVVDTALTVNVGGRPEGRPLVEAARAALDAAIAALRPGIAVRRLSEAIAAAIAGHGLRPVRNLCGHGVGRWTVHCPPPIPNVPDDSGARLAEGAVVAIEPFATSGLGLVAEEGEAEVFRLDPELEAEAGAALGRDEVLGAILSFRGLPFARRQLAAFAPARLERTIADLRRAGVLRAYAPLVETSGRPVAQAEHTVYLGSEGVEVLTV